MSTTTTTTQKQLKFRKESRCNKPVTDIPGIGEKIGSMLVRENYREAGDVLLQYDQLRNETAFTVWLRQYGANSGQARHCYEAMKTWASEPFMQQYLNSLKELPLYI